MEVYRGIADAGDGYEYGYVYTFGAYQIVRMKIDAADEPSLARRLTDEVYYDLRDVEARIARLVTDGREGTRMGIS